MSKRSIEETATFDNSNEQLRKKLSCKTRK